MISENKTTTTTLINNKDSKIQPKNNQQKIQKEIFKSKQEFLKSLKCKTPKCNSDPKGLFRSKKDKSFIICEACLFNNDKELQYYSDNFDDIINPYSKKYSIEYNKNDAFSILNQAYESALDKLESKIKIDSQQYDRIVNSRHNILSSIRQELVEIYYSIIESFENTVKELNDKVDQVQKSKTKDEEKDNELITLKINLNNLLDYLNNENSIKIDFDRAFKKAENKLSIYLLKDLLDANKEFSLKKNIYSNLLSNGKTNVNSTDKIEGTQSYWCVKSNEILTGNFVAKFRVNLVNTTSDWHIGVGIIKSYSTRNDYYTDSIILMPNGNKNRDFSGSNGLKITEQWVKDDIIIIKRDIDNKIFMGLNNEDSITMVSEGISEEFKIVIGFMSTITEGNEIELVSLEQEI